MAASLDRLAWLIPAVPDVVIYGGALLASSILGALIVSRVPANPIGWLVGAAGMAGQLAISGELPSAAEPEERAQFKWLVPPIGLVAAGLLAMAVIGTGDTVIADVLVRLGLAGVPVGIGIAVVRHRLSQVNVSLTSGDGGLCVVVRDDGAGFVPDGAPGSGLIGLRDRVEAVGGAFEVTSAPDACCTVTATIPIPLADEVPTEMR